MALCALYCMLQHTKYDGLLTACGPTQVCTPMPVRNCCNSHKKNHYTSYYNIETTALQHLAIVCVCTHSCYIMSVTTTVLLHCLAPSESSANINGQSHLCVVGKAGDVTRKPTVMPATVIRTGIACSNGVTAHIGVVRSDFVKA